MRTSFTQLICLLIFSVFVQTANAQIWKKLPDHLTTIAIYDAKELDGNLWVCHSADTMSQTSIAFSEWTGEIWKTYPAYNFPSQANYFIAKKFVSTGDSIFVLCEYFDSSKKYSILKFTIASNYWLNTGVTDYLTEPGVDIQAFELYENNLFLGGNIPGLVDSNVLIRYDAATFALSEWAKIQGKVSSLCALDKYLLIGGDFYSINGDSTLINLVAYDTMHFPIPFFGGQVPAVRAIERITPDSAIIMTGFAAPDIRYFYKDSLMGPIGPLVDSITVLHGAAIYRSNVSAQSFPILSVKAQAGNRIYKSLPAAVPFQTGINSQADYKPVQSGDFVYAIPYVSSAVFMPNSDIFLAKASSLVKGKVFADLAGNCTLDSGDLPLPGLVVGDTTDGIYTITDNNGNYELETDADSLGISVQNREDFFPGTCGVPTVDFLSDSIYNLDVPLTPNFERDVSCQLSSHIGWRARQGFTENYIMEVKNDRIYTVAGKVVLTLPNGLTINSSDITPSSSSGNVYEWNISSLTGFQNFKVNFSVVTPLSIPVQTDLKFIANAVFQADSVADNNSDTLVCTVVGAFDPNDKQCFPSGVLESNTEYIRYHIRFQNTGSDTAYRVTIIDTIDLNLPYIHFRMRSKSHTEKMFIEKNVVKWVFDNIQLPDSGRDMEGSQGFLEYEAKIRKGLKIGDSILNTAYIYFDYQKPVLTNTVISYYGKKASIKEVTESKGWLVYPNPSRSSFTIERGEPDHLEYEIKVINILGKTMWNGTLNGLTGREISTETWPAGCYFIQTGNKEAIRLVVIR